MSGNGALVPYLQARWRAERGRIWSTLAGRSRRLYALAEVGADCAVPAGRRAKVRCVPLRQVRGSEGREGDFDRDFYPLQDHSKGRWMRVAAAHQGGKTLPPVELIQIGDVYFVRDGHHRISVARAMGQLDIDAEVAVWQVTGPLPWETQQLPKEAQGESTGWRDLLNTLGMKLRTRSAA
jgi:hypothetical protein